MKHKQPNLHIIRQKSYTDGFNVGMIRGLDEMETRMVSLLEDAGVLIRQAEFLVRNLKLEILNEQHIDGGDNDEQS